MTTQDAVFNYRLNYAKVFDSKTQYSQVAFLPLAVKTTEVLGVSSRKAGDLKLSNEYYTHICDVTSISCHGSEVSFEFSNSFNNPDACI